MTIISANDAFTNPSSPWYYVIGSVFLLLVIAALVIYSVVSKKKRERREEKDVLDKNNDAAELISGTEPPSDSAEQTTETEKDSTALPEAKETAVEQPKQPDKDEAPQATEKTETKEPANAASEPKAEAPEQNKPEEPSTAPTDAPEAEEKPTPSAPKPTKKSTTTKKTQKPFIDKLIADKTVHGVYNELKNTIMSYPGMKAKLGKDGETFAFMAANKAELSFDGKEMLLKLAVDPNTVPPGLGAEQCDGELNTKLQVGESNVDAAQKLIMFTMNVSMLTRNDRHRHVDYVQNAINAKNRAKSKQASTKAKK